MFAAGLGWALGWGRTSERPWLRFPPAAGNEEEAAVPVERKFLGGLERSSGRSGEKSRGAGGGGAMAAAAPSPRPGGAAVSRPSGRRGAATTLVRVGRRRRCSGGEGMAGAE